MLSGISTSGRYWGGTAVAISIVKLLPVELLVAIGAGGGMAMVLALSCAAIAWNLGTWYLGLPASSSHTLIGSILGIGLTNAALQGRSPGSGVDWGKAGEVMASLLISPVLGFLLAAGLYLIVKRLANNPRLEQPPTGDKPPPPWIRAVLVGTCSAVSMAHGSNDGQKGVGLIMLILIGLLPSRFALNPDFGLEQAGQAIHAAGRLEASSPAGHQPPMTAISACASFSTTCEQPCRGPPGQLARSRRALAGPVRPAADRPIAARPEVVVSAGQSVDCRRAVDHRMPVPSSQGDRLCTCLGHRGRRLCLAPAPWSAGSASSSRSVRRSARAT